MELNQPSPAVVDGLRNDPKTKVLVVGSKDGNFPDDIRNHPQMIFWDSNDPSARKKPDIPKGVRVVIFLKFLSTAWYRRVKDYAKSRGVWFPAHAMQTGEARRLINAILPPREVVLAALASRKTVTPVEFATIPRPNLRESTVLDRPIVPEEEPVAAQQEVVLQEELARKDEREDERSDDLPMLKPAKTEVVVKQPRGAIKAFAYQHFRIDVSTVEDEAHRVCALAIAADLETTPRYIQFLYYKWKKDPNGYAKSRRASVPGAKLVKTVAGEDAGVSRDRSVETTTSDAFSKELRSSMSEVKAALDLIGPAFERLAGLIEKFLERSTVDAGTEAELTRLRRTEERFNRLKRDLEDPDEG